MTVEEAVSDQLSAVRERKAVGQRLEAVGRRESKKSQSQGAGGRSQVQGSRDFQEASYSCQWDEKKTAREGCEPLYAAFLKEISLLCSAERFGVTG